MLVSVIVPAYNEERRVGATLDALAAFREKAPFAIEPIVVDDGSTDATTAVLEASRSGLPDLTIARHTHNRGKGAAVATGMELATGSYRAFFDADGATPFDALSDLLHVAARRPGTIAIGSVRARGAMIERRQPLLRSALGRAGNAFIRAAVLPGVADSQRGCKVFPATAADIVFGSLQTDRWGFDIEVLARSRKLGYEIVEVPVEWTHVAGGQVRASSYVTTLREVVRIRGLMHDVEGDQLPLIAGPPPPLVAVARKPA